MRARTLLDSPVMNDVRLPSLDGLRVCSPPTFARQILVPHLESFTAAHPEVELEVVLSIPYLGHEPADADIVVRTGESETPLMRDVIVPVASPALLQRLPPLRTPA